MIHKKELLRSEPMGTCVSELFIASGPQNPKP